MIDIFVPASTKEIREYDQNPKLKGSGIIDCIPQIGDCPNNCKECVTWDTKVLLEGFIWKNIVDVKKGDKVASFKVPDGVSKKRSNKFIFAEVEEIGSKTDFVYEVITDKGSIKCTENHPFFNGKKWFMIYDFFKKGKKMKLGSFRSTIKFLSFPCDFVENKYYKAGYICGLIDGDGTNYKGIQTVKYMSKLTRNIRVSNYNQQSINIRMCDIEPIEYYVKCLKYFGIETEIKLLPKQLNRKQMYKVQIADSSRYNEILKLYKFENDLDFGKGWMAGFFDSEGTKHCCGISVRKDPTLENNKIKNFKMRNKVLYILNKFGFKCKEYNLGIRIKGGYTEHIRFFSTFNPKIKRKKEMEFGKLQTAKILDIKELGIYKVYNLQTSSGTFYANGFATHNCFYNGPGFFRSKDTPLVPILEEVGDKIVRVNSGNDSNNQRDLVIETTKHYKKKFYNTSIPKFDFPGPIVFTANPSDEKNIWLVEDVSNIMMVRFRTNPWNIGMLAEVVGYYVDKNVPVTVTFMRYRNMNNIPVKHWDDYEVRVHILNKWAVLKQEYMKVVMDWYRGKDIAEGLVGMCGTYESSFCADCGRCEWAFNRITVNNEWKDRVGE